MMWKNFKESFLHLFFPQFCIHCEEMISPQQSIFCLSCASQLELINTEERCIVCFEINKNSAFHACTYCRKNSSLFHRTAAAFDYMGPACTLIKKLKYANQPQLASGMAAFLVMQFLQLNWPFPDFLIPIPISFSRWFERGYNQSSLIAEEMSKLLKVPVCQALSRRSGDFSQASLTLSQRLSLKTSSFKLKKNCHLDGKILLFIDDVVTSGATLNKCAEVCMQSNPSALYALTFCKASIPLITT